MNDATPLPFTSDIENIIKRARIQVLANLWTRSPETPRDPSEASEHHSLLCTDPRVISLKAFYDLPQCGPCKKRPSSETCLFQNLHAELMQYESIRTTTVNFTHGDVARPLIVMNDIWTGVDALLNFEKTGDDLQPQTQQQAELLVRRLIPDDLRMSDDIVGNTTLKDALSRLLLEPPSAGEPSAGEPIDDQFLRVLKASIIQLASNLARGISTDTQLEELGGLNFSSDMLIMPSRYDDEDPAINSNTTFKLPSAIENMASHPDDQEMLPVSSPDDREMLPSSPSQEPPGDRETTTPPTLARRPSLWTLRDSVMVTCFRAKSNKERWDWTPLSNLNIALNDVWTVEKQAELAESTAQPRPILSLADIVDPNKKHQTYTLRSDFYNFTSTVVYNSELMAQFAALKFPQENSRISNMNWQNSDPEKAAEKYCIQQPLYSVYRHSENLSEAITSTGVWKCVATPQSVGTTTKVRTKQSRLREKLEAEKPKPEEPEEPGEPEEPEEPEPEETTTSSHPQCFVLKRVLGAWSNNDARKNFFKGYSEPEARRREVMSANCRDASLPRPFLTPEIHLGTYNCVHENCKASVESAAPPSCIIEQRHSVYTPLHPATLPPHAIADESATRPLSVPCMGIVKAMPCFVGSMASVEFRPMEVDEPHQKAKFRQRRFDQTIDFLKKLANVVLELRESVDPISVKRPVYQMDLKCDNVAVFFEKYPESARDGSVCTDHASFWTYAVTCLEFLDKQVNKGTGWMHTEDLIDESSSSSSSTKKKYQTVASYFHSHGVTARGQAEVGRRRAKAAKNTRSDNIGRRHLTSSAGFWNNEITTLKKLYAWFIDEYEFGKNCEIPFVTPMMEFLEELKASEKPRSVDEMYRSLAQEYAS
ncbi:hypothetical protein CYMTET_49751 [Cymbomonas tetramitiformis]|uniref:Uncharacterized protein n=1 Tax=Cymbomonas tetramitiformis TaxID=36881 RepID=A0AAE0BQR3_9CHLO|nr:hypothetical protein CYMTET_49751 [Cymbomonas tetramitiformis]